MRPGVTSAPPALSDLGVGDVVNDSGNALGQVGGGADPDDDPVVHDDGGVADEFDAGP